MVVIVTRDVADRFRGFLASCMLEIAPGVYTAPRMTARRARAGLEGAGGVVSGLGGSSIVMTWRDVKEPCGQGLRRWAFRRELSSNWTAD